MFYIKILVNLLFIVVQIRVSTNYQYKRSLLVAILYTMYVIIIFPHITYGYIYLYLCIMLWFFFAVAYFQRENLFSSKKSRTETK